MNIVERYMNEWRENSSKIQNGITPSDIWLEDGYVLIGRQEAKFRYTLDEYKRLSRIPDLGNYSMKFTLPELIDIVIIQRQKLHQ